MIDPSKPNATIELETADLLQLGQSGLVEARANKTRELQMADLEELREGMPIEDPKVVVDLGPDPDAPPMEQNVFVDFGPEPSAAGEIPSPGARTVVDAPRIEPSVVVAPQRPPTPLPAAALVTPPTRRATPVNVQRVTARVPDVGATSRSTMQIPKQGGMGLVVFVYLVSAAALAASIYFRWFAT